MGTHVLKFNKVPLFAQKIVNINVSRSAAPKLALVPASRYKCDVKFSRQVSLGLNEVQMGPHVLKLYKGLLFAQKGAIILFRGLLAKTSKYQCFEFCCP